MEHFYFWSMFLGGSIGIAIIAFGRIILSSPALVCQTREAYENKGLSPIKNTLPFLLSLQNSVLHFARTYADAIEIKDLRNLRGYGNLTESISVIDILLIVISLLMPIIVFGIS